MTTNPETYSRGVEAETQNPGTGWASVDIPIPDYFPSGTYWLNNITMQDVALNWRRVYFTAPRYALRPEDEVIDEAPQTIEVETTIPDITPPELDVNRITIQAEPTRPEDPDGETQVDITFRIRDNISGYRRSSLYLRDPQGVEHHFYHHHRDFHRIYFRGDPTAWETNKRTINLPVGSLPGIWGLAQMTVEDKAQNILRSDFTETIRFEVIDPDSQVTAFAIPQALLKVSGDEQSAPAGEALPAPFVVSVLDQNKGAYPGAPVTFKVIGGQGTLSVETTATDSTGQAATTLTLGRKPGINTVEVIVAGLLPVTFTAEGTGVPHRLTRITGDEQTGPAGRTLSAPFVVSVLDQNEEAYPGALVTFEVTGGQGSLSVDSATTDSTGKASTTLTLGDEPGLNTVDAVVAGLPPVTFTARGARIPQTLTKVSEDEQRGAIGTPLSHPFVVSLLDHTGQPLPGTPVEFVVAEGQGTLSTGTGTTDENGQASTVLTLGDEPGTNSVDATVEGLDTVRFTAIGETTSDFDGDGVTGLKDFFLFADSFGSDDPRFDLDGSGTVDFADFFLFADFFGEKERAKLMALAWERIGLPREAQLLQNTPNPFNSQTVVEFVLPEPGWARLEVFGLTGQRVAVLAQGPHQAGRHRIHWDARDSHGRPLASGIYLWRLSTGKNSFTRRFTLLR